MGSSAATSPAEQSDEKTDPKKLIAYIHSHDLKAGIAIKPGTKVDVLWDILENPNAKERPDVSLPLQNIACRARETSKLIPTRWF